MSQYKFDNDVIHGYVCINAFILLTVHTDRYFAARMPRKAKLRYNQTEQFMILVE